MNHVTGHLVRPLEDLGAEIHKEGVRGPASEDHDLVDSVIHQEETHGGAGADRSRAEFECGEPEG